MSASAQLPLGVFQNIGMWEVILISSVILLLFGAKRLPELFRAFGESIREFKKGTQDIRDEFDSAMDYGRNPGRPRDLPQTHRTVADPHPTATKPVSSEPRES